MPVDKSQLINKLRVKARRGNLESDLLLQAFIDALSTQPYSSIWPELDALLDLDDQTLLNCLLQPETAEPDHINIIQLIRKNYLNSTD
ncbi:succinate dehydrogenase assembly factor 2 [Thiomicrospira sp. R3]|uniref:succinate dehydrogenase assembly factor 2 n=1 Tax=Thiomicrospira sp. R3 TaxID=3035472 RepID=UPI00338E41FB